jgi:hypothetical protein
VELASRVPEHQGCPDRCTDPVITPPLGTASSPVLITMCALMTLRLTSFQSPTTIRFGPDKAAPQKSNQTPQLHQATPLRFYGLLRPNCAADVKHCGFSLSRRNSNKYRTREGFPAASGGLLRTFPSPPTTPRTLLRFYHVSYVR